jgi:hypothetical protein
MRTETNTTRTSNALSLQFSHDPQAGRIGTDSCDASTPPLPMHSLHTTPPVSPLAMTHHDARCAPQGVAVIRNLTGSAPGVEAAKDEFDAAESAADTHVDYFGFDAEAVADARLAVSNAALTPFGLRARLTGEVIETVDAKGLFRKMAVAAWGGSVDPGRNSRLLEQRGRHRAPRGQAPRCPGSAGASRGLHCPLSTGPGPVC